MLSSESRRCLCQLQCDWWKVALDAEIPANWQRVCGLASFVPPYTGVVCQSGWYTGPGINELLVSAAFRPWRIGGFKTSRFHLGKLPFVHLFRKMERNRLSWVYGEFFKHPSQRALEVMCVFSSALKWTEQRHLTDSAVAGGLLISSFDLSEWPTFL